MVQKSLVVLLVIGLVSAARAVTPADPVRTAVAKGLRRVEQGAAHYLDRRRCFSCHHQALPILTLSLAPKLGYSVEPASLKKQVDRTVGFFRPKLEDIRQGQWMPGGSPMAAHALVALGEAGYPPDGVTKALVGYLLHHQEKEGQWIALGSRPPSEGSPFSATALVIRGFAFYRPPDTPGADRKAQTDVQQALARAKEWLEAAKPESTEDKSFALRGLVFAGADKKRIDAARDALAKEQHSDGSWSQLPELAGDAYATATVLTALHTAGLKCDDATYQKGVRYLLATQHSDGSWIVTTRAKPVQVFFDNGDAGGKSQFISFTATNWALLALLETQRP
jgi:hypothetical protein